MEDILIPIVAITSVFGLPVVVVVTIIVALYKSKVARYTIIKQAIENNASPEVIEKLADTIAEERTRKSLPLRQSSLIHGTILLALGLTFLAFYFYSGIIAPLYIGTLLSILSVAKFIIAFFILKETPQSDCE